MAGRMPQRVSSVAHGTIPCLSPGGESMTEKSTIIVKPSAARQFESFWERGKVLFFSAPCGIGKMALADTLLERYPVLRLHAGEASFTLPSLEDAWQTLLIDDLQYMQEEQDWQALCAQIRESTWRRFSSAAQNT